MSKKKKSPPLRPKPSWEWRESTPVDRLTRESNAHLLQPGERFIANELYNVHMTTMKAKVENMPDMVWLSISRRDRKIIRDWRHLQRIKNELVGPECEGVEIFPAESRLVDTSNQFHLWVFNDPTARFPWGFEDRAVMSPEEIAADYPSAVQRPFEESGEEL